MRRGPILAGGLCAALLLTGCQSWQDRADAAAFAECAKIAGAAERKACQADVMAGYSEAERREKQRLIEAGEAADERELQRKVYGTPKDGN